MKKYFLSFFLIIAFAFYVMLENQSSISIVSNSSDKNTSTGATGGETLSSQTPTQSNTTSAAMAVETQPATSSTPAGLYRDGSYNGDSVNAYFGNIQVEAVVSSGKLSDVKILAYPDDRGTSVRINNGALPKLVKEAIASQSAQVDIVSGATQTSQGFQQSLASALAKAKS